MAGRKHIHKYCKRELYGTSVWTCALPTCTHYMPKHLEEMVKGKYSVCWECDEQMIMGPLQMERDKPICDNCNGTAEVVELSPRLMELLKQKGVM